MTCFVIGMFVYIPGKELFRCGAIRHMLVINNNNYQISQKDIWREGSCNDFENGAIVVIVSFCTLYHSGGFLEQLNCSLFGCSDQAFSRHIPLMLLIR